ncbi:MAG: hypothetical protein HY904_21965 [Deltaproteobacteria bacterium]|nr:hypothetical protein [Deltaproteobacteria bacterium]
MRPLAASLACLATGAATLGVLAACDPANERACDPGATQPCTCPDGTAGQATCWYDGYRWSECHCGLTGASSGGPSSSAAGTSAPSGSSGPASGASSGPPASSAASGAADGGACLPSVTVLCSSPSGDGTDHVLTTTGSGPRGITGLIEVGMTRAQVSAAIGDAENILPPDPLAASTLQVSYCARRLYVEYADGVNADGGLNGYLTDDDRVARVSTIAGFAGHADTGLVPGATRAAARALYATDAGPWSNDREHPGGLRDLWPATGVAALYGDGGVRSISVHAPNLLAAGDLAYPVFATREVVIGTTRISARLGGLEAAGSTFGAVKAVLGPADEEGFGQLGDFPIAELSYVNLGMRFAAQAGGGPLDDQTVIIIILVAPFQGLDPAGQLGLGSTRAEWDSAGFTPMGPVSQVGLTLERYRVGMVFGGLPLLVAVSFQRGADCVERAAAIVIDPPAI